MATVNVVTIGNLGTEFDIGVLEGSTIRLKLDGTLQKDGSGNIGVDLSGLSIISGDAGNVLVAGGDDGAFFDQAALQAIETVWAGVEASGFMAVTPAGTNGHAPTFVFDYANAAFVEGVQDAIGAAVLAGAGITYNDVADSISSALGALTFGDGLTSSGLTAVAVLPDPASVSTVTVSATGVAVTPGISVDAGNLASAGTDSGVNVDPAGVLALLTVDVCDAFNVHLFDAAP